MPGSTPLTDLASSVPAAPGVADIVVEPAKLLEVARVVDEQVSALEDKLLTRLGELRVDTPSSDTVSVNAMAAWNTVVAEGDQSYAAQVRAYVANLHKLVGQLREAAKTYEASDADKAAAFGDRGAHGIH
ncbi:MULTISPECIES: PE domain-containing protein [Amycolatopsis]|uniref:PE domain-containing protein n=4 Tax=Amycolatopsis TaxID=1813 RepID=A0A2N3WHA9_9PSEU|nr:MULTISPECIES: PE domain-containing protein [Amycolatopsis]MBB1155794.1 PE domain-containing protein [Amycolatopsis dendrobii]MBB2499045.1 PE domain-containing protein [Amycolatopsis echigonensis]MCG3749792.1 PE domain-containing protein [Amycolatopsis sp. Poz14]MYW92005.1 PE domain-containing protein [Amycolatopsis rubida]NEC56990.1 PE domain-containing protein [Amycolatopsis rubida]